MEFSDYIVYADESGDHSLTSINPQNPVFVLVFCIFEKSAYLSRVVPALYSLKFNFWGRMPNLDIRFMDKKHNAPGLQIADLAAHPIGRHVINPEQENRAFDIIEPKLRKGPNGQLQGYGLKIFP